LNILVSNDDGISSEGIQTLVTALAAEHDIYVCAPDMQRSGAGHGITIMKHITATAYDMPQAKMAYMMSGTPADCVKMGHKLLADDGVEVGMVFSGINNGGNIGTDTLYSGTVSAALEGAVCGLPAVAVSIHSLEPKHYELATQLALRAARLDFASIDDRLVLNINVPDLPLSEVKGVKVTGLGTSGCYDWNLMKRGERERMTLRYGGEPIRGDASCVDMDDVCALGCGYATVTPIHFDLTSYPLIDKVRASGILDGIADQRVTAE
jgi:5'-nucleotidase